MYSITSSAHENLPCGRKAYPSTWFMYVLCYVTFLCSNVYHERNHVNRHSESYSYCIRNVYTISRAFIYLYSVVIVCLRYHWPKKEVRLQTIVSPFSHLLWQRFSKNYASFPWASCISRCRSRKIIPWAAKRNSSSYNPIPILQSGCPPFWNTPRIPEQGHRLSR